MPRQPRLDAPGASRHVMGRGIEGTKLFLADRKLGWPPAPGSRHSRANTILLLECFDGDSLGVPRCSIKAIAFIEHQNRCGTWRAKRRDPRKRQPPGRNDVEGNADRRRAGPRQKRKTPGLIFLLRRLPFPSSIVPKDTGQRLFLSNVPHNRCRSRGTSRVISGTKVMRA
jgi:hypothetical protein